MTARVLVVEDDPRIAAMLSKGLGLRGHAVDVVNSGLEAIEAVGRGEVDLMILDLGLPDIDGLDVLDRLRSTGTDLPVIVVSARSDPRDRRAAERLGATSYLMKPFAWVELWRVVEDTQRGDTVSN